MLRSRLGLKVLGLCALGFGVMGLGAGGAQAETGAHWNVVNSSGTLIQIPGGSDLLPQVELKEIENNTGQLLFTTAGGTKVAILCSTMKFTQGGLLQANGGVSLGRVLFDFCLTKLNGSTSAACKPRSPGSLSGSILTQTFTGLIVLDVGNDLVKITPENEASLTSKLFAKIELGEECAIGTFVNVEAKFLGEGFWLKDTAGNFSFLEEKEEHLISEALNGLVALGQPATLDGSAWVRLAGFHFGLKWGGTPA